MTTPSMNCPAKPISPIVKAPPSGYRSEVIANIVGHMKQTPT